MTKPSQPPALDKGWRLVPVEPTEEMITAGWSAANDRPYNQSLSPIGAFTDTFVIRILKAALAATPPLSSWPKGLNDE